MGIWLKRLTNQATAMGLAALLIVALVSPMRVHADPLVQLSGGVTSAHPDFVPGAAVYATAPGGSTALYGPVITSQQGRYRLDVTPGTYDIHIVPLDVGWVGAVAGTVKTNVTVTSAQTLDVLLGYKQVSEPTGATGELRCGGVIEGDGSTPRSDGLFTLMLKGAYGFAPHAFVTTTLYPGAYNLGGGRASEAGVTYGGTIEGLVGTSTQLSSFRLAPGDYNYTLSAPDVATPPSVAFSVPTSCPHFDMQITPAVADDYVLSNTPFPVALLSTAAFNAPARIDTSSLKFGFGYQTLYDGRSPQSCQTQDVNGDGLNDLLCNVTVGTPDGAGTYSVEMTGRTLDQGSSADGFLFFQQRFVTAGTILSITDPTSPQPELTWNAYPGAAHYNVYRDDQLIGSTAATTYTDHTITAGGDYFYYVQPILPDGSAAEPSGVAEAVIGALITPPTGLSAVSPTNNAPVLTWDDQTAAISYNIYREDTSTGVTTLAGTSTTNNFTDVYQPGIYNYTVTAVAGSITSGPSAPLQVAVINSNVAHANNIMAQGQTQIVPVAGSDVLPGLSAGNTKKATFDFNLGYSGTTLKVKRPLSFSFAAGGHSLFVTSTSADWLVVNGANNSTGTFQGLADVTLDNNISTGLPYTVTAVDGSLTTPASPYNFKLTIYSDASRSTVLYSAHENLDKGKVTLN